nr:hypothetical protein [Tanacetum cinerariifolium]
MTGNKSYLTNYEEIDGGFVAFGELKFNLFSVLQMRDKKNSVLFTDTACVVLSPDFKLTDESHVLLKVSIKDNMYNVDLKNIVRQGGYSTNSKAFRVFNSRTRIVEENLHIKFSENTPNIAGSRHNWLFDIDALTKSMNYKPVVVGNHFNGSADSEVLSTEEPRVNQEKDANVHSTNNINIVNAASNEVNVVGRKSTIELLDDPNMPELEDMSIFEDSNEDVFGVEADLNNLESTFQVIPILITRIHKDYSLQQVIRDLHSAPQIRRMTKNLEEHGLVSNVFSNKLDERGIVIKNKERLVAQGHTQEEGIDYNEVFAPVARIKAIRLFLAYSSFKDFVVYQMDVNSAFLYGKIEEEVYVCQPPSFEDPDLPDKVYKVEKALNGLHQSPIAWYTKKELCTDFEKMMHKKFQNEFYRRAYIFLRTSIYGCARFQVNSKISHLHAVKRIFRYLKGQPKLGLWYPKDSPFDLVSYTDNDYARASLDRKSTTGGCQFLGCWLTSWQCKKQTVVANFTTEAEYVAASSCCGQVLWIQN